MGGKFIILDDWSVVLAIFVKGFIMSAFFPLGRGVIFWSARLCRNKLNGPKFVPKYTNRTKLGYFSNFKRISNIETEQKHITKLGYFPNLKKIKLYTNNQTWIFFSILKNLQTLENIYSFFFLFFWAFSSQLFPLSMCLLPRLSYPQPIVTYQ